MDRSVRKFLAWAVVGVWLIGLARVGVAAAAEVSFKERFAKFEGDSEVLIQARAGDLLVIEPGTYTLRGRKMIVTAEHARIDGPVTIRAFNPLKPAEARSGEAPEGAGDTKEDGGRGLQGHTGKMGFAGKAAQRIVLNIKELDGVGPLTLRLPRLRRHSG